MFDNRFVDELPVIIVALERSQISDVIVEQHFTDQRFAVNCEIVEFNDKHHIRQIVSAKPDFFAFQKFDNSLQTVVNNRRIVK